MNIFKKLFSRVEIIPTTTEFKEPTTTIQGKPIVEEKDENGNIKPTRVFKYASDIHLEMRDCLENMKKLKGIYEFEKKPNHRYFLALVGDIGSPIKGEKLLLEFLKLCSNQYERVFYIAGNHEYYNQRDYTIFDIKSKLRELIENNKLSNVHFLDNEIYQLDEFRIIGSTLWSLVDPDNEFDVSRCLNDYRVINVPLEQMCDELPDKIRKLEVGDTNRFHKNSVNFIKYNMGIRDRYGPAADKNTNQPPCIVLTHHAPQFNDHGNQTYTSHPKYQKSDRIGQAFSTDLSEIIKPPISVWIYGHTHFTTEYSYNNVKILANQHGYEFGEDIDECKFNSDRYFIF
ncbi:hypothetical protein RB653_008192 [Dictyostelium firmibasis]|uniref:Calcineurin-like phosphoesterase domain-containing protein n=1 Tax=Dictyostelium firmibasis TaxID=79012 RepID=A0AAN7U4E7_9MYCE